ncbi:hypothetical protein M2324_003510 [Rhodovulum sulfidophilum]|uniref:hypothetical protein n=1 Tax=Rhodovulum sulfidophilum TaxID=35806 RepID=UPI0012DAC14C|nr:hypothetical protein [Rhodovulum sulfidophilum]MCW2305094.1 hypothetical protein [Rhodovulum sulfidophilum]
MQKSNNHKPYLFRIQYIIAAAAVVAAALLEGGAIIYGSASSVANKDNTPLDTFIRQETVGDDSPNITNQSGTVIVH